MADALLQGFDCLDPTLRALVAPVVREITRRRDAEVRDPQLDERKAVIHQARFIANVLIDVAGFDGPGGCPLCNA